MSAHAIHSILTTFRADPPAPQGRSFASNTPRYNTRIQSEQFPDHELTAYLETTSALTIPPSGANLVISDTFDMDGSILSVRSDPKDVIDLAGEASPGNTTRFSFTGICVHIVPYSPTQYLMELQIGWSHSHRVMICGTYSYPTSSPPRLKSAIHVNQASFLFFEYFGHVAHFESKKVTVLEAVSTLKFKNPFIVTSPESRSIFVRPEDEMLEAEDALGAVAAPGPGLAIFGTHGNGDAGNNTA